MKARETGDDIMAHGIEEAALGVPMSWEEFLALPDESRAEYVDGRVFVNPPPSFDHQETCQRIRDVLRAHLGGDSVVAVATGWRLPGPRRRLRIPDVMLLAARPGGSLVADPPLVAIEVLSSNRSSDLVRKATEYLEAGAGQYWIVDPRDRVIDAFVNSAEGWEPLARLTDAAPEASITMSGRVVKLRLADILG